MGIQLPVLKWIKQRWQLSCFIHHHSMIVYPPPPPFHCQRMLVQNVQTIPSQMGGGGGGAGRGWNAIRYQILIKPPKKSNIGPQKKSNIRYHVFTKKKHDPVYDILLYNNIYSISIYNILIVYIYRYIYIYILYACIYMHVYIYIDIYI